MSATVKPRLRLFPGTSRALKSMPTYRYKPTFPAVERLQIGDSEFAVTRTEKGIEFVNEKAVDEFFERYKKA